MKKVILILSLFCFILFSQTVGQVANDNTEPAENYNLIKITSGGNDFWIVRVNGVDEFVIDSSPKIVTDRNEIIDIFIVKFEEESMLDYKREQVENYILNFQDSQYPERATCEQYTGLDKMPCYDRESCLKACFAVPICSMIRSEPFIFTILDWSLAKDKVDNSIEEVLNKLENANTISQYSSLRSSINSLKGDMEEMEENGLYSVYGFCGNMDISYSSLNSANSVILDIEDSLKSEPLVRQQANVIYELTSQRVNFFNERVALYNEIHSKVSNLFEECEENYLKTRIYDEDIEYRIAQASNYLEDMLESRNEGNYKIAIEKGNNYYSTLNLLKGNINNLVINRRQLDLEINNTLETYFKSIPHLKNTKYDKNFTLIKQDIDRIKGMRIISSEVEEVKLKIIGYDEEIKEMVSDCVLNGCEKIEDIILDEEMEEDEEEKIEEVEDEEKEIEEPKEDEIIDEKLEEVSLINKIIFRISSLISELIKLIPFI